MKKSIQSNFIFNKGEADRQMEKIIALLKAHDCSDDFTRTQIEIIEQLIESGSHFGMENTDNLETTVSLCIEEREITVEIKRKVTESDYGKLEDLDRTIQRIRGCQTPYRPNMANFRPAHSHAKNNSVNGFELSGLVFDAGVDFDFYVDEEDILNLFAVRRLEQGCGIDALTEVR
jgi:ankyrin repeat protein